MNGKILVIDDEPSIVTALVDKLTGSGFKVKTARDGREGLRSALKNHPDLILLDIIMPVMNGLTMLHKLREDDWGRHAKVILLTNLSDNEKTCAGEAENCIVKSDWTIEELVKKIKKHLTK